MRATIDPFPSSPRAFLPILLLAAASAGTLAGGPLAAQETWSAGLGPRFVVPAGELSDWDTGVGGEASVAWRPGRLGLAARGGYVALDGDPDLELWTVGAGPRWELARPDERGSLAIALELQAGVAFHDGEQESATTQMVSTAQGPAFVFQSVGPVEESVPFLGTGLTVSLPLGGPFALELGAAATWAFVGDPIVTASETLVSATDGRVLAERSLASFEDFPLVVFSPAVVVRF